MSSLFIGLGLVGVGAVVVAAVKVFGNKKAATPSPVVPIPAPVSVPTAVSTSAASVSVLTAADSKTSTKTALSTTASDDAVIKAGQVKIDAVLAPAINWDAVDSVQFGSLFNTNAHIPGDNSILNYATGATTGNNPSIKIQGKILRGIGITEAERAFVKGGDMGPFSLLDVNGIVSVVRYNPSGAISTPPSGSN